ncbi:MAG: AAA family ATPase [Chloroflexaceae bacterium]|nr:AAA family ATPase [Chloroflexaceae bacterium]
MIRGGHRALVLFGAPVVYEHDLVSALKLSRGLAQVVQEAETEIRDFLAQNLFEGIQPDSISTVPPPRVGLSSGIVYAGLVGSSQRCEYTVIGPLVNLAARLMGTAQPGEILLPLETYQRMRVPVATHRIEPVQLKGFSKPIETVQLAFDQTLAFHEDVFFYQGKQTELIGREAELEQLLAHARATFSQQPQGHIVTLMGEAGVGKSRLVDAFVTELYARLDAPRVIRETCHNYEQTMPYAVITRLVRQILQVDPHAPDANEYIVRRIHQLIPDQLQLVWLLEGFLNIEFDDDTPVMFLQPDYRREKLHDLIITLLREAAKLESLVLVIEDFAWIDASSYELLQSFNQSLPSFPLLLLCVMRTLPDGWQSTDVITLEDLSDERSRAFMRSMLDGDLPPELEAFVARAGGRPIFLEEIIYYLIQTGMLRRNDQGRWECTGPLDDSIPSQIERLIVARLDKMTVSVRQMINIAAVLGMRMSVALLNEVCRTSGISPEPLEAVLSTLLWYLILKAMYQPYASNMNCCAMLPIIASFMPSVARSTILLPKQSNRCMATGSTNTRACWHIITYGPRSQNRHCRFSYKRPASRRNALHSAKQSTSISRRWHCCRYRLQTERYTKTTVIMQYRFMVVSVMYWR